MNKLYKDSEIKGTQSFPRGAFEKNLALYQACMINYKLGFRDLSVRKSFHTEKSLNTEIVTEPISRKCLLRKIFVLHV